MPIVIEAMGLPGAGKTTIMEYFMETRTRPGRTGQRSLSRSDLKRLYGPDPLETRITRHVNLLSIAWRHRTFTRDLLQYVLSIRPISLRRIQSAVGVLYFWHALNSVGNRTVVVLDEGILQAVAAVLIGGHLRNESILERLISRIASSFHIGVVKVELPHSSAFARMMDRGTKLTPFEHWDAKYAKEAFSLYESQLEQVYRLFVGLQYPSLTLCGSDPVDQNATQIEDWLRENFDLILSD